MIKDYYKIEETVTSSAESLAQELPEMMDHFVSMAKIAKGDHRLAHKTKLMIGLAVAISTKCEPCIARHVKPLVEYGVTRQEVAEIAGVCVSMSGALVLTYAAAALEAFDQFSQHQIK